MPQNRLGPISIAAANGVHDACKLGQQPVSYKFNDTALMALQSWLD